MDSVVPLADFSFICRICLAKRELSPLSDPISRVFLGITNIHVKPEDGLPQNICLSCVEKLEDISEFIEFSKLNDAKLRRTLNNRIEYDTFNEQEPIIIKEDISIKDEYEDFGMSQEGWIGEEEMDYEDSEECVPEYIERSDIQEAVNESIVKFEPICDLFSSGTTLQDITSETEPTEDSKQIGGEASLELINENEKNPFPPKKTLVVRLMRLKILRLKAKSVNFRSIGNSNNFVTIRMGTKPQTITNLQPEKTEEAQGHGLDFPKMNVERLHESHSSLNPERNINHTDAQNKLPSFENNFDIIDGKPVSVQYNVSRINKMDPCLFCKKDVMGFAHHILRYHSDEKEVVQITSHPINSTERKLLMLLLKKKSNYLKKSESCCNPMRRTMSPNDVVLHCTNCLGFYKQLCSHVKKCSANPAIEKMVQADTLNFLFPHRHVDEDLESKVFPRMRTDNISRVAKRDNLICEYGANFFKTHLVETHVVHVTSRKMRELARFLIEINKMNPTIKSLQEALNPQFYELIVKATRIIGKYDAARDTYKCPTFVTSIGYMLRQCCDIAIILSHEKKNCNMEVNTDEAVFNFNMMMDLFGTNWKEEVLNPVRNQNL